MYTKNAEKVAGKRLKPNASASNETKRPALFVREGCYREMEEVTARRISDTTLK